MWSNVVASRPFAPGSGCGGADATQTLMQFRDSGADTEFCQSTTEERHYAGASCRGDAHARQGKGAGRRWYYVARVVTAPPTHDQSEAGHAYRERHHDCGQKHPQRVVLQPQPRTNQRHTRRCEHGAAPSECSAFRLQARIACSRCTHRRMSTAQMTADTQIPLTASRTIGESGSGSSLRIAVWT